MYGVTRIIDFCYGHRLMNYSGKCRHPHGHNGRVEITVEKDALDELGMVVDFGEIKEKVKVWIDNELDHRFFVRQDDPLLETLTQMGEPVVVFEENPTAETIARKIFSYAKEAGLPVKEVRMWETANSFATVSD